jgi:hypothetical protein
VPVTDTPRALPSREGHSSQPSPLHSGRGHSTAYTHRHFPLPSLVQDCSDGPLALAEAPNPHMPQHVSLRLWLPDNAPSALVDVLAQTPTHISRPSPKTPYCAHCPTPLLGVRQLSHVLYCPAPPGPRTTETLPLALSQARKSPHRKSRQPLSSFAYPLSSPKNSTRPSPERRPQHQISKSPHCPLFSNSTLDRPSCSSQNISLFALRGYLLGRFVIFFCRELGGGGRWW